MELRKHLPVFVPLPSAKETAEEVERHLRRLRESEWRGREMKFFDDKEQADRFREAPVVFVDAETAGTYPFLSVVHLGVVVCRRREDGLLEVEEEAEFYVEPPSASAWDEDYRGRYYDGEVLRERYAGIRARKREVRERLAELLKGPLVWAGHNPAYDLSLLSDQDFVSPDDRWVLVDTLDLAGWVLPVLRRRGYEGGMDLEGLVRFLNGGSMPHGAAHDALADCRNAVFLFNACCRLLASADGYRSRRVLRMVDGRFVLADLLRPVLDASAGADAEREKRPEESAVFEAPRPPGPRWGRGPVGAEEFFPKGLGLRPTQKEMVGTVGEFLDAGTTSRVMYLEAPTGTGKTYAYLASMLAWAASAPGRRFFVSTYTKSLQSQIRESLDRILEGLPEDLRFSYEVVKGKRNYLCEQVLLEVLRDRSAAFVRPTSESVLAGYLWLYLRSFPEADGEAEGLLPPALERNWVERRSDLRRFCYHPDWSFCKVCEHTASCAVMRKAAILRGRTVPVVVTNHALMMLESDAPEEAEETSPVFSRLLVEGYPVGVFDEGHRLYDAWCSVNRASFSSADLERLALFLHRTVQVLEDYLEEFFDPAVGALVDRLKRTAKEVWRGLREVEGRVETLVEQDEGSRSGYPERMARLDLSDASLALYRARDGGWRLYPAFLSGSGLFTELGTRAFELLRLALGLFEPVGAGTETYERIAGLARHVAVRDVEVPVLRSAREVLLKSLETAGGKSRLEGFFHGEFEKVYGWWEGLDAVFRDCDLGHLVMNNLFHTACLERARFAGVVFRGGDYWKEFRARMERDGRMFVFVRSLRRGRAEEGDEPEFGESGSSSAEGEESAEHVWEFVVVPTDIPRRIREKTAMLEKALVVSATLSGRKADGQEFYPWLNGYASAELHKAAVVRMPETFRLDEQMLLAVPEAMPLPLEYYNEEFRHDVVLEVWRILAALRGVRTPSGRPARILVLLTSRFNLYYLRFALEKARQVPGSPLRGVDLFFQEEMPREELRRRFMAETGRPAALFGLRSFGEGFDVAGEENPVRVVVIDKLPFLSPVSEYHQAMTERLRRLWQMEEAMHRFGPPRRGPPPVRRNLEMTDYILPLSVTEFRQWAGRLVRKEKDRGLLFVLDGRILRKSYGMMFRRSLHERLRYVPYGRAFLEFKNRNINGWRTGVTEPIPHPFAELAEAFRTFLGVEELGPVYDHGLDKVTEIRLSWLHQPDRIRTRTGEVPRYFSSYFMNMMRLLREHDRGRRDGKEEKDKTKTGKGAKDRPPERMELGVFLKSRLGTILKDGRLAEEVRKHVMRRVREYAASQGKDEEDFLRIPLEVGNFRKSKDGDKTGEGGERPGPSFADELRLLMGMDSDRLGAALYDLIVDRGTGWRGTVSVRPEDGRVVYLSQRRISAYVFGIDEERREELERTGGLRTDGVFVLSTGFGKTLCFQIPALMDPSGLTVVFSPLRALMRDHVRRLRDGLLAAGGHLGYVDYLDAEFRAKEEVLRRILTGDHRTRLLYVNPNRLMDPVFFRALLRAEIRRCVIDEVHTMIQWGDEFAPAYNMIPVFLEEYLRARPGAQVPVFGFTATLTPRHREELERRFGRVVPALRFYAGRMDRPEIAYGVLALDGKTPEFEAKTAALERLIRDFLYEPVEDKEGVWKRKSGQGKMVVFFRNVGKTPDRPGVKQAWRALLDAKVRVARNEGNDKTKGPRRDDGQMALGIVDEGVREVPLVSAVTYFHAPDERDTVASRNLYRQFRQFERGRKAVMLTTEAFGMGVDIKNIRKVVHFDLPWSVDQYCQQTGRSREGGEAVCLWHEADVARVLRDLREGGKDRRMGEAVMGYLARGMDIDPRFRFRVGEGLTVMLDYSQLKQLPEMAVGEGGSAAAERMADAVWPWLYEAHFRERLRVRGTFLNWNSWIDVSPFENTMEVRYGRDEEAAYEEVRAYLPDHLAASVSPEALRHLFGLWMGRLRTEAQLRDGKRESDILTLYKLYEGLKAAQAVVGGPDAAALVYACCHDWLAVASVLLGLVKLVFGAYEMSGRIVVPEGFTAEVDLFRPVAARREEDFRLVCEVLSPDRRTCRREGLVAAFNEQEARSLHRAETCCDICSGGVAVFVPEEEKDGAGPGEAAAAGHDEDWDDAWEEPEAEDEVWEEEEDDDGWDSLNDLDPLEWPPENMPLP